MITPAPSEIERGAKVMLYTSLNRDDLFTWLEAQDYSTGKYKNYVDTWEIPDHPDGNGGTFTLYAVTLVLVPR